MKWKNRLTNYNFWISIVSAVLLILQAFHINFDIAYINEIATAVLGLLVVIGIINDPTKSLNATTKKDLEEQKEVQTEKVEQIEEKEVVEGTVTEEKQAIPTDVKDEAVNSNNEVNFKAVIEFISSEIKKEFNNLGLTKEQPNLNTTENVVENNAVEAEEPICYNIVN